MRALVLYHGDSLAHTVRPLLIACALRARGHEVILAGEGTHTSKVEAQGFTPVPLQCVSQRKVDEHVSVGNYDYYTDELIDSLVKDECTVIRDSAPDLIVADFRPTMTVSAALEGRAVAVLTGAYNQPGYPFPIQLPSWVVSSPCSIAQYGKRRSREMKRHRVQHLVADVPEVHPPTGAAGYQHVGPLIEPLTGDELPQKDDKSVLLYLGSTGQFRGQIREIAEGLAQRGWAPVVVLGDGSEPQDLCQGVRIFGTVHFPSVLRRASACVCVGGSGTIYHAIAARTPILGTAEHLDQDFNLNRVRDLGLGAKLRADELSDPETLSGFLAGLSNDQDVRNRLGQLAPIVRRWSGGGFAADVLSGFASDQSMDGAGVWVTRQRFVDHLARVTPPEMTPRRLRRIIKRATSKGMPVMRGGRGTQYCRVRTLNWLMDNDPDIFEAEHKSARKRRRQTEVGRLTTTVADVRFEVTFSGLDPDRGALRAFLPYPRISEHQEILRTSVDQDTDMMRSALPTVGMIYGMPFGVRRGQAKLSYRVCVRRRAMLPTDTNGAVVHRRWLEGSESLRDSPLVADAIRKMGTPDTAWDRARNVYDHLMENSRYERTRDRCQCISCATHAVLQNRGAHCVLLAHAFIGLCRSMGIPARSHSGALLGHETRPGHFEIGTADEPVFGHTWAEFWSGTEWVPVEFHAIAFAPQSLTEANVQSESLRYSLSTEWQEMRDHYFGWVDSLRVECSEAVKTIPILLQRATRDGRSSWVMPDGMSYDTHLTVDLL